MLESLNHLESESVEIIREAYSTASNPVVLYSIGKDSTVLVHLVGKAFAPADPPIPLLHIDTTWKFADMYAHRNRVAASSRLRLIVHVNQKGVAAGINPFTSGSDYYTEVMKTDALKQALDEHRFDVIFGGARRDEERSRAKERIVSVRSAGHRWDPRNQRPELWSVYNTRILADQTLRVFPLSNWTELDVWRYIEREQLPVVPLYFAADRRVVRRGSGWLMLDDDRFQLQEGEIPEVRSVRFRTLGCYPLTAGIDSSARNAGEVIRETLDTRFSERQGRLIDFDQPSSMEKKKQDGYF
jgi:sulfate adenylyltransferase subunit 2